MSHREMRKGPVPGTPPRNTEYRNLQCDSEKKEQAQQLPGTCSVGLGGGEIPSKPCCRLPAAVSKSPRAMFPDIGAVVLLPDFMGEPR